MKPLPQAGDTIEARQVDPVPIIGTIILILVAVGLSSTWIQNDDPVRGNDVEFLVGHFD